MPPKVKMQVKRGLQEIFDKHPDDKLEMELCVSQEDTDVGHIVRLPSMVTSEQLKNQARKDYKFPEDKVCMAEHQLTFLYPEETLELLSGSNGVTNTKSLDKKRVKRGHHGHKGNIRIIVDDAKWTDAKRHWGATAPRRRDISLVKYTAEVAEVCSYHDLISRVQVAGPHALESALRLCSITGVPLNVTSLVRLRKIGLVYQAIVDLVEYRDPAAPMRADGRIARAVPDNCEPLVVACGAHLHWYLGQTSPRYRFGRVEYSGPVRGVPVRAESVPPKYEKFQRLILIGQSHKVRQFKTIC